MMKKISFTVILVLYFLLPAEAQQAKPRFQSINTAGFAFGQSEPQLILQTINGVSFSKGFAGVGLGIDYYDYKTLPLFIDGRWFFGDEKKGFIYGDIGYNFPLKNKPGKEVGYYNTYDFSGGIYTGIGIGYKAHLFKKSSLLFSLGYSYKQLQTKIGITLACVGCQPFLYDYKFGYGRMVLKAGLLL